MHSCPVGFPWRWLAVGGSVPEGRPDVSWKCGFLDTKRQRLAQFPGGVFTPALTRTGRNLKIRRLRPRRGGQTLHPGGAKRCVCVPAEGPRRADADQTRPSAATASELASLTSGSPQRSGSDKTFPRPAPPPVRPPLSDRKWALKTPQNNRFTPPEPPQLFAFRRGGIWKRLARLCSLGTIRPSAL